MEYNCTRQVEPDGHCKQSYTSLARHYNSMGKVILILAMLFGKFKMFSKNGGKEWTLMDPILINLSKVVLILILILFYFVLCCVIPFIIQP